MNIKLHTPKSLKAGSGMSSMKQFLLSLLATTVSIALTFGTAAIVDHNKKQREKREIVMMVMYDMYNSLMSIENADSLIRQSLDIQRQVAENPTLFDTFRFQIATLTPRTDFTETTERIFSSSIETINTVGNVLFTENVAEFYQMRHLYKTMVCDSIANEIILRAPATSLNNTLDFSYSFFALLSREMLKSAQHLYAQCKQMMKVSDEEIEVYRKEREQIEKGMSEKDEDSDSIYNEIIQIEKSIIESKEKLKLE